MIIAVNFPIYALGKKKPEKSGLQLDSNPWPLRCRCDALPTDLWSHKLGARSIYWVHVSREEWNDVKNIWIIELFMNYFSYILHVKILLLAAVISQSLFPWQPRNLDLSKQNWSNSANHNLQTQLFEPVELNFCYLRSLSVAKMWQYACGWELLIEVLLNVPTPCIKMHFH